MTPAEMVGPGTKTRGERFGRYLLVESIGKGGMAEIFRAVAHGVEGFQRVFVVKRILKEKSSSPEFIEMFANEARISALLHHPNIVQIYEFGQIDGSYFLAMEYLRGKDLLSVLRELRRLGHVMPPEFAGYIAQQVATGLGYAHSLSQQGGKSLNIVHRDVSPSNVMLLRTGGVKLLDFGIAKAAAELKPTGTTQAGLVKGKLSYLSPEQVRGERLDGRSDVFSLGVVLWECLTGKRLFYDKNDYQTMRNVVDRPVPPPSTQRADVPPALDYIVVRALERDLGRRYSSAKQMADDLDNYIQEVRFSATMLPRFLDDIFGPDDVEVVESQPPPSVLELPALPRPTSPRPIEAAGARGGPTDHVPPVAVTGTGAGGARRPRWQLGVAAAVVLTLVAATASGLLRRGGPPGAGAPAPRAAAGGPAPTGAAEAPAAVPATVSVRLDSEPSGAEVLGPGDAPLGVTPLTVALPRTETPVTLIVRKGGFQPATHAFVPDRNLSALLTLRAQKPPPRPSALPARRRPAAAPVPARAAAKVREGIPSDPFVGD
jgi:eukaryotic-like serine/threonine-protein kinase